MLTLLLLLQIGSLQGATLKMHQRVEVELSQSRRRLVDYEMGVGYTSKVVTVHSTLFYMDYKDQLVNTGKLNDVGYPLMTNVASSYRTGVEFDAAFSPYSWVNISGTYR